MGDNTFAQEVTHILCVLEEEYVGDISVGSGVTDEDCLHSFGLIVGQMFRESVLWQPDQKELMELCIIRFISKWMSPNQPHWVEQGKALCSFLTVSRIQLSQHIAVPHQDCLCNITTIVLCNAIKKDIKKLYLSIIQLNNETSSFPDDTQNYLYTQVEKMLSGLDLSHLLNIFQRHGIRDATLHIPWPDLHCLLNESSLKLGHIYKVKMYLQQCKANSTHGQCHCHIGTTSPGVLMPPSAFLSQ